MPSNHLFAGLFRGLLPFKIPIITVLKLYDDRKMNTIENKLFRHSENGQMLLASVLLCEYSLDLHLAPVQP